MGLWGRGGGAGEAGMLKVNCFNDFLKLLLKCFLTPPFGHDVEEGGGCHLNGPS